MNTKTKSTKIKFVTKFSIILLLLTFLQFLLTGVSVKTTLGNRILKKKILSSVLASNDTQSTTNTTTSKNQNEDQYLRLTDIEWMTESRAGYDQLRKNQTDNNGTKISIKREGAFYTFDNGIWAHANSNIYYDISEYSQKYHYLTMYVGLNQTARSGDGVKFWIYTSNSETFHSSGQDYWTQQKNLIDDSLEVDSLPGSEAKLVKIDISGAKYLRLQAYQKSGNGSDHSVYVNPMLITDEYKEQESQIPTVAEFDEKIKNYKNKDLSDPNYELLVLQRKFISSVGNYALQRFIEEDTSNAQTIEWLMNDLENLRYYILGGAPTGSYFNSLKQLTRLLKEYKSDFNIQEQISDEGKAILEKKHSNQPTTKGNLYKRMAITLSLTHSSQIALWMQPSAKENQSDAVKRYEQYKYMYENDMFKATDSANITPWFETYTIEEMRYVMHVMLDDEETIWLNEYTQSKINAAPASAWSLLTPHSYMAYIWPNYGNNIYYSDENYEYFNNLFSVPGKGELQSDGTRAAKKLYDYGITRGTTDNKIYKLWMNMRNKFNTGAVCGGISKTGHCIRGSHAIPSAVIGQPGHAAIIYYHKNSEGQGYWGIDNDVSGWTKSEKGERLPLGWGNDRTYVKGYNVPYIALAQEALNDYNSLVKAEELLMTVDTYSDNKAKQEEIYRKAIKEQSINLDAWAGLVKLYLADSTKTEADYYSLAKEMMESLKCFPFTMYNLANTIKPKFTTNEYKFKYSILETRILTEGKNYNGTDVLQPSLTRTLAASLLGSIDTSLAKFSFDGTDAEKIILSSRFDTSGIRWDYSLDGKKTWKEVSFTAEEEHKLKLTSQEIKSITAENDIYVHIVGVNYSDENVYKIDIQESAGLPSTLYANDMENRVIGVNLSTEWRYTETDKWTSYGTASPNLTGNKTLQLRQGATGTRLASTDPVTYTFTPNNDPDTRRYIPVSHISLHSVSTQATNNGGAAINALDANYNTRWHSAWNGTDTNRFIVVKLDKPVNLSAVEFVPAGGGNGRIVDGTVYGSSDGENWEELTNLKNITWPQQANSVSDAIKYTKNFEIPEDKREQTVEYVKIVADRTNGNWFAARAFNFYEDITKKDEENEPPTASIAYSTTEKTNEPVIARLVNPSTNIKITNNDGKSSYIFTENGEFTFTFEDEHGNKGSTTAKVNWIDKDIPTADIKYKLSDDQKLAVVLDNISEDVYLLDKNGNKTNYVEVTDGKIVSVSYINSDGTTYKVAELDENKVTTKITYTNTTNVKRVAYYVTAFNTSEDGTTETTRLAYDTDGNVISDLSNEEVATLRTLEQTRSNPLEFYIENEEEYEFKLLDLANNLTNKYIKINYIDNNTKILTSDITYSTTATTNQNVVATINAYVIASDGKNYEVQIINNDGNKTYTFEDNGSFTFEYSRVKTEEEQAQEESEGTILDMDIESHTAKVNWIDKIAPTATIKYSKTEKTNEPVVATLVNESEPITLLNNGANRTYTFTKNGEFTFEFQDKAGNIGKAKAQVDWIEEEPINPNPDPDPDPTPVVIKGDVDGDGEITVNDLAKMKLHFLGLELLEGKMFEAADMNENNEIDVDDIAQIKIILLNN